MTYKIREVRLGRNGWRVVGKKSKTYVAPRDLTPGAVCMLFRGKFHYVERKL